MLCKKVQIIGPLGIIVRIAIDMPYMRHPLLFEVLVHFLANTDQSILVTTAKPQYFELLFGCHQIRQQFGIRQSTEFIGIRG